MIVSKKRLEAVLNLSSSGIAQVVDLEVLGCQVVEAQHVAEAKWRRSWHLAEVAGNTLAVGELPRCVGCFVDHGLRAPAIMQARQFG
eukprot:5328912-Pleurochrysis_carterae.AAC.1